MKIVYNKNLKTIEEFRTYTDVNDLTQFTTKNVIVYNDTILSNLRIEDDSYVILETEELLVDINLLETIVSNKLIDYNDLRKYLIVNLLPNWESLTINEQLILKSYYIVPNGYVWDSTQTAFYKILVDNATKCRESRIDQGRSYVSLFYITDTQKSMDFFIDTELLMNQYIKGKIPALEAFINDSLIAGFDYTTNGFSTKSYYNATVKDQLNYLLFR